MRFRSSPATPAGRYGVCYNGPSVISLVLAALAAVRVYFRRRTDTALEVLALRQQVAALKRRRPRPPLSPMDRLFWTVLRQTWARWKDVLVKTTIINIIMSKNVKEPTREELLSMALA